MAATSPIVEIIKTTVHEFLPDAEVMLFGSRARNEETAESDFDILLIAKSNLIPKDKLQFRTIIRKALLLKGIRSDILIQSRTEVKRKKNLPGHIVKRILSQAILI